MPFPIHYRAVIEGGYYDSSGVQVESWSTSYRVVTDDPSDTIDEDSYIAGELTDFTNRLIHTDNFGSNVKATKLAFNRIGADGKYASGSSSHFTVLTGSSRIAGTSTAGIIYPLQVCIVTTLRSDLARGPASHGRMYLPMPALGLQTNFKIPSSQTDTLRDAVKDAFEHADGVTGGLGGVPFYPALVSAKGVSGTKARVTRVGVGQVFDTMRSRRASLTEGTTLVTLT